MEEKKKILIVEDEVGIRETLVDLLQLEGYETLQAEDGEAGFLTAVRNQPDLILSDVMMPNMGGCEFVSKLRSFEPCRYVPVVMLSAKTDYTTLRQTMQTGADDYLIKPFERKDLINTISYRLERNRLMAERVRNEEKKRMRLEMHDVLQQNLVAAKYLGELIEKKLPEVDSELHRTMEEMLSQIDLAFINMRAIVEGNLFDSVYEIGFVQTLTRVIENMKKSSKINVQVEIESTYEPNPVVGIYLIQSISEICINTLKHSKAENLGVKKYLLGDMEIIEIWDDGVGFDQDQVSSIGLNSIRDKLREVGSYQLITSLGKGVRYIITIDKKELV